VPVGTADKVSAAMAETLTARGADIDYQVCSNPEFLKEGAAVADFMKPDRIVIGTASELVEETMRELYGPFNRNHDKILFMDVRSAELTKYAANAMLATKISFMNEMANLAEHVGADIEAVRHGIGSDPRIGYQFIYPGCGYGGSCFPKDVQALAKTAGQVGYEAELLNAVEGVNNRQKHRLFAKLNEHYQGQLAGKTIAIWGLSFKPNTDDMREAPSRVLMESLWQAGAKVQAYDPVAAEETQRIYGERPDLHLCEEQLDALTGADALVVCTDWSNFKSPDFELLASQLADKLIIDGRNIYDPASAQAHGLTYRGIGRRN
jgi:UDPglucose 6-dehydrogenase